MEKAITKTWMYWGITPDGKLIAVDKGVVVDIEYTGKKRKWFDGKYYEEVEVYHNGEHMGIATLNRFTFSL